MGVGLISLFAKLHKWDDSAMFFDGSSLCAYPTFVISLFDSSDIYLSLVCGWPCHLHLREHRCAPDKPDAVGTRDVGPAAGGYPGVRRWQRAHRWVSLGGPPHAGACFSGPLDVC